VIRARRWRRTAAETLGAEPAAVLSALVQSASEAVAGGWQALDRLVDHLVGFDRMGDTELAGEALAQLQAMPRVVARLDEHARRVLWWSDFYAPLINEAAKRVRDNIAGPIAIALASTHGDGHVREAAVARMLAVPDPGWMPFLVLRTSDWVKPVRDRARAGLALLLADDPRTHLPAVLGMTLLARARLRGGFAYTQALAALVNAPQSLRDELLANGDTAQRRFVFDLGLGLGWWSPKTLFAIAVTEPDRRTRPRPPRSCAGRRCGPSRPTLCGGLPDTRTHRSGRSR